MLKFIITADLGVIYKGTAVPIGAAFDLVMDWPHVETPRCGDRVSVPDLNGPILVSFVSWGANDITIHAYAFGSSIW